MTKQKLCVFGHEVCVCLLTIIYLFTSQVFAQSQSATSNSSGTFTLQQYDTEGKSERSAFLRQDTIIQAHERYKNLVVFDGNVSVYGTVKNLVVFGGNVELFNGAKIEEDLVIMGGNFKKNDGAQLKGDQVHFSMPDGFPKWLAYLSPAMNFFSSGGSLLLSALVKILLVWLVGSLMYFMLPNFMRDADDYFQQKPFHALFYSIAGLLAFVPGIILLAITIIGIFFIPLYVMLFSLFSFCGFVILSNFVGRRLPPKESEVMEPLRLLYGVSTMVILSFIPLIGSFIVWAGTVIGAGALLYSFFHQIRLYRGLRTERKQLT